VPAAFERGVTRATERGGLLHHLFGVRALGLTGELAEAESSSYLSGLLIGHEIKAALADAAAPIHLVGTATLCTLYAQGLAALGIGSRTHPPDVAARGLARLAGAFA
jgi:2-dehydro-3-deoxygalactonokinase